MENRSPAILSRCTWFSPLPLPTAGEAGRLTSLASCVTGGQKISAELSPEAWQLSARPASSTFSDVEVFGTPGAGKSTLCRNLMNQSVGGRPTRVVIDRPAIEKRTELQRLVRRTRRHIRPVSKPDLHPSLSDFFAANPGLLAAMQEKIDAEPDERHRKIHLQNLFHWVIVYRAERSVADADEVLVWDAGFAQRALSSPPEIADKIARVIPLPRAAIAVTAEPDVAAERIHQRGFTPRRMRGEGRSEIERRLGMEIAATRAVAEVLEQRGVTMLRVDTTDHRVEPEVTAFLETAFRSTPAS